MTNRRRLAAKLGPKWWNRNDHISFYRPETGWVTYSQFKGEEEVFEWPRPCSECNAYPPEWHYGDGDAS